MPVPPPPPPPPLAPPPPPPPSTALPQVRLCCPPPKLQLGDGGEGGRNALLADIQKGPRLRKVTQVNDRSAPAVESKRNILTVVPKLSRSSSTASLKPIWTPPTPAADTSGDSEPHHRAAELRGSVHRKPALTSSAPPSPSHSSKQPPPFPSCPPPLPATPPSAPPPPPPPPPQGFQDRPATKPPPLPSCPPPPSPSQSTKPTWLPIQHSPISQPSTPPPPPPPPPFQPPSTVPGDRSAGCFYPPPPLPVLYEPARFHSPLGPPPPPPPLPASFTRSCPSTLPPPPPKLAPVPSPALRILPPSYPCSAPTRRPPAVPRIAGRKIQDIMTSVLSVFSAHLPLADDFESKFQFHPVEDLPPPDEFKPFPRIYPSKENGGSDEIGSSNLRQCLKKTPNTNLFLTVN
uniref:WH2 domain-containing protein n=1 Tax=Mola mola TaxID=94237 RepID=A0A3Q3XJD6_MOLML